MAFTIVSDTCEGMGECRTVCPVECIVKVVVAKDDAVRAISAIDPERCTDCGACRSVCPIHGAILNEWHPDRQAVIPTSKGSGRTALEEAQTRLAAEFDVAIAMAGNAQTYAWAIEQLVHQFSTPAVRQEDVGILLDGDGTLQVVHGTRRR